MYHLVVIAPVCSQVSHTLPILVVPLLAGATAQELEGEEGEEEREDGQSGEGQ